MALNVGVFGSVDTLPALAEKALSEVVDKALDDTALRNPMRPATLADPRIGQWPEKVAQLRS